MFINLAIIEIAPGREGEFEASSAAATDSRKALSDAPGFVSSTTLKDVTKPGRYFYISVWESLETIEAFRASAAVVQMKSDITGTGLFKHHDQVVCDLVQHTGGGGFF